MPPDQHFLSGLLDLSDLSCLGPRKPLSHAADSATGKLEGVFIFLPLPVKPDIILQIKTLGGRIVGSLESVVDGVRKSATHCVVPCGLSEDAVRSDRKLEHALRTCREVGHPIAVETTWIDKVARSETWHVVLHEEHTPPVLALLDLVGGRTPRRLAALPPGWPQGFGSASTGFEDARAVMPTWREPGLESERPEQELARNVSNALGAAPPMPPASKHAPYRAPTSAPTSAPKRPQLSGSLAETFAFLRRVHPDQLESEQMAKAIENSLLDFALQLHAHRGDAPSVVPGVVEDPLEVLGVVPGAPAAEVRAAFRYAVPDCLPHQSDCLPHQVRAAFRRLALKAHPDRGGSPAAFLRLQRAYQRLTAETEPSVDAPATAPNAPLRGQSVSLLTGPRVDLELREHRALVEAWFEREGANLEAAATALQLALSALGLTVKDVGTTNRNERGETMANQCFYLSLARAFLREDATSGTEPARSLIDETALTFKRVIEAAVLRSHPEWAGTQVGDDLQAFSDFLFFVLGSGSGNALLSELAVAIFDSTSGAVEVFRGIHYPDGKGSGCGTGDGTGEGGSAGTRRRGSEDEQRANLLCLHYVPGHYQALVATNAHGDARGPTLAELVSTLDLYQVRYVLTDG